ncbi:MAG: DUF4194 domain-containing protein [Chitinophagaceae bacterium]|nr:DUF4194 domain-containing protein [Polaromonas sp.]
MNETHRISESITDGVQPTTEQYDLTVVVVPLLKGVIYREEDNALWAALLKLQSRVRDYTAVLGLNLVLDEAEGYAFLQSKATSEDEDSLKLPRLIRRQPLTFYVSLLLVLLRKKLVEFDASGADTRLILPRDAVVELIRVFLPTGSNESRLIDNVETHLNKIVELGFVRRLKPQAGAQEPMFEVRRILKAFVDAQWLADFDLRLAGYQTQLAQPDSEEANDKP